MMENNEMNSQPASYISFFTHLSDFKKVAMYFPIFFASAISTRWLIFRALITQTLNSLQPKNCAVRFSQHNGSEIAVETLFITFTLHKDSIC